MVDVPDEDTVAAYQNNAIKARKLIRIQARDRDTGDTTWGNFWNGTETRTFEVIGAQDGETAEYEFLAAGSLVSIDDFTNVCEQTLTDHNLKVTGNLISSKLENIVRGYDLFGQLFEYYVALFDLTTNTIVAPARPKFLGYIDQAPITTAADGDTSDITITVRDHASDMSRTSLLMRSHESEILRLSTDTFLTDEASIDDWEIYWGSKTIKTSDEDTSLSALKKIQGKIA